MSGGVKTTIWIIIAILILGSLYYWYVAKKPAPTPTPTETAQTKTQSVPSPFALPSGTNTSDDALSQDLSSTDADIAAMAGDNASIDAGLNDKQVAQ